MGTGRERQTQLSAAAPNPIAILLYEMVAAGAQSVIWDGRIRSGAQAPSGHYILRLEAGGGTSRGEYSSSVS